MQSSNNKNVLKMVLGMVVGGAVIVLALPILMVCIFGIFSIFKGDTRRVNDTFISPSGIYQVESINNSGGAMDQGESFLCIEFLEDGKDFSVEEDKPSKKAVEIEGIHGRYGTEYDVEWTSDDSFTVTWDIYDNEYIADVVIDGRSYTITNTQTITKQ